MVSKTHDVSFHPIPSHPFNQRHPTSVCGEKVKVDLRSWATPRIGRVNFQKVVQEGDPKILKHFKHVVEARPITIINKDESETGSLGADQPLVVTCLSFNYYLQHVYSYSEVD